MVAAVLQNDACDDDDNDYHLRRPHDNDYYDYDYDDHYDDDY